MASGLASLHTGGAQGLRYTRVSAGRCVFAHLGDVAMQVWFGQCEKVDALALAQISRQMQQDYPGGISTVHWLYNVSAMPTPEARQHFAMLMDTQADWFGEVAIVMEAGGFWAGAVRAMLNGIRLAAGSRAGFRVFGDVESCTAWMPAEHVRRTGQAIDGAAVAAALHQIIAEHG